MWARRCGAPRRWPSRVKVAIFTLLDGTIGLSIYLYMAGSSINFLDLRRPRPMDVICLRDWGDIGHAASWETDPREWFSWWREKSDLQDELERERCSASVVASVSCQKAAAPVGDMARPLGRPMSWTRDRYIDVLGLGARLFLALALLIWVGIATHDQALICPSYKNLVLDVRGVNYHCPLLRKLWRCLAGHQPLLRILKRAGSFNCDSFLATCTAILVVPVFFVWNVFVFNFVIVPTVLLAFLRYPIRMCRVWVFIVCIATGIYGLALTFMQLGFAASVPSTRPHYAVTWQADTVATNVTNNVQGMSGAGCVCGCDYPISRDTCIRLAVIGMATTMKSLFVAFRCLKGLRRSQWANLLSVVFPVPMTVYSVDWRQPDGQPIKHRVEGMAVQEEVAFDPFAMMDEQPDGDFTTLNLAPTRVHAHRRKTDGSLGFTPQRKGMEMPVQPPPMLVSNIHLAETEHIGCCGFPWPTGGRRAVYMPHSLELLDGTMPERIQSLESDCLRLSALQAAQNELPSRMEQCEYGDASLAQQEAGMHDRVDEMHDRVDDDSLQRTTGAQSAAAACCFKHPPLLFLFRLILPAWMDRAQQRT